MSAIAFLYTCAACCAEFEAPETPEMSYGLFVMRTPDATDAVLLEAVVDAAFKESSELVKRHPLVKGLLPNTHAPIVQAVFSETCDRSPDGKPFKIGITPKCPSCGSQKVKSWIAAQPGRAWPLRLVEHRSWEAKSVAEKNAVIDHAVRQYLEGCHSR